MLGKQYKHMKHCTQTYHSPIDDTRITPQECSCPELGTDMLRQRMPRATFPEDTSSAECRAPRVGTAAEHNAL